MTALLVGVLIATAGWQIVTMLEPQAYGRPAWLDAGQGEPGSLPVLLRTIGQHIGKAAVGDILKRALDPLRAATLVDPDILLGLVAVLAFATGVSLTGPLWAGPALALALLWAARDAQQEQLRELNSSWETDVVRFLQQVRLSVVAGLTLRQAIEQGAPDARGVAAQIAEHLMAQWSGGVDTATSFAVLARELAPDASTGSFLQLVATAVRDGSSLRPILDGEVDRLRERRRARLTLALEKLPSKLAIFRGLGMLAAMCLMFAWAFSLLSNLPGTFGT